MWSRKSSVPHSLPIAAIGEPMPGASTSSEPPDTALRAGPTKHNATSSGSECSVFRPSRESTRIFPGEKSVGESDIENDQEAMRWISD
ncbi:MAG: hypothetical protein RLZ37_175 [Actinomycetota bacterium]